MQILQRRFAHGTRDELLPTLRTELAGTELSGVRRRSRSRVEILHLMRKGGHVNTNRFATLALVLVASCAPAASTTGGGAEPAPTQTQTPPRVWPVLTRSHVDLWLHGYAMLLRDTTRVPVFRRGYRERVQAAKNQRSMTTLLDANRERLQSRLALSPALINGQFVPMYFASFEQMQQVIDLFLRAEGNPSSTNDATLRQFFLVLASSYPAGADREWLRIFIQSLEDERRRFYQE